VAAEDDVKKLFIQVESEDSPPTVTPASSSDQSAADFIKEEFRDRLDELAELMSTGNTPVVQDLPSHKGDPVPRKKDSLDDVTDPNVQFAQAAAHQDETAETGWENLEELVELADALPEILAALEKSNRLLQEISEEDQPTPYAPSTPEFPGAPDDDGGDFDPTGLIASALTSRAAGAAAGAGAAGGAAGTAGAGGAAAGAAAGPVGLIAGLLAAQAASGGGGGGQGGGQTILGSGGMGDLAAFVTADPLAKIGILIDSLISLMESLVDAAFQIDEHILSLGDDVRSISGEVQLAEAETQVMQLEAMMRRNEELGPLLGDYIRERARLDTEIADLVTELEAKLLPVAVTALTAINDIVIPAIEAAAFYIEALFPEFQMWLAIQRERRNERFEEQAKGFQEELEAFLKNKNTGFAPIDKKKFPQAEGVFF
jgi:hypothetical protein